MIVREEEREHPDGRELGRSDGVLDRLAAGGVGRLDDLDLERRFGRLGIVKVEALIGEDAHRAWTGLARLGPDENRAQLDLAGERYPHDELLVRVALAEVRLVQAPIPWPDQLLAGACAE